MFRGPNISLIILVSLLGGTVALYVMGKALVWVVSAAPWLKNLLIVTVIGVAAIVIFAIAAVSLVALWAIVFEALGNANTDSAKNMLKILGDFDFQRNVKSESKNTSTKLRGAGMLGTLVILFAAVAAIYFLIQMA